MIIPPQKDYQLLDSGDEMKLERYGRYILARPDPQAIWPKKQNQTYWDSADAIFIRQDSNDEKGKWHKNNKQIPDLWPIELGPIHIYARMTPFKHTGIFPEQYTNWVWTSDIIKKHIKNNPGTKKPKILNLFGYSGGASVACAMSGAEVTHVDASKSAIGWAKENMNLNNLDSDAIRWILDDAMQFAKRELKRGNRYDGIMMDPPVFGRGAKGEVWKIERDLLPLLEVAYALLSDTPLFFILNGYAAGYSATAYANNLLGLRERFGGRVEAGELLIEEFSEQAQIDTEDTHLKNLKDTGIDVHLNIEGNRYLPCGILARWTY